MLYKMRSYVGSLDKAARRPVFSDGMDCLAVMMTVSVFVHSSVAAASLIAAALCSVFFRSLFFALPFGIRCEPFAAPVCRNPVHMSPAAQADVHFQVMQVVGGPRGPESKLHWARGFRLSLGAHSLRIFGEAKQRQRGAAPPGAHGRQPPPSSGAAGSSSGA